MLCAFGHALFTKMYSHNGARNCLARVLFLTGQDSLFPTALRLSLGSTSLLPNGCGGALSPGVNQPSSSMVKNDGAMAELPHMCSWLHHGGK
jgi:hypothetical protein